MTQTAAAEGSASAIPVQRGEIPFITAQFRALVAAGDTPMAAASALASDPNYEWWDIATSAASAFRAHDQLAEALAGLIGRASVHRDGAKVMWKIAQDAGLYPLSIALHDRGCATSTHWIADGAPDPADRLAILEGMVAIMTGGNPQAQGPGILNPWAQGLRIAAEASTHWPSIGPDDFARIQAHNKAIVALLDSVCRSGLVLAVRSNFIIARRAGVQNQSQPDFFRMVNTAPIEELKRDALKAAICFPLWRLPERIIIGKDLLIPMAPIGRLPNGLRVGGTVSARASNINTIGAGTEIGGVLDLRDCANWDGLLPDDLVVGKQVMTPSHPMGVSLAQWRQAHPKGE